MSDEFLDSFSNISGVSEISASSPSPGIRMASAFGSAVDTTIVNKPSKFTGEKSKFSTWKFVLLNYMRLLSPSVRTSMDESELLTSPIVMDALTDEKKEHSRSLYAFMAQILDDRPLRELVRYKATENGFECWRKLISEYEPKSGHHAASALMFLMKYEFLHSASDSWVFRQSVDDWETIVETYETSVGEQLQETVKFSIVMQACPDDLKGYLATGHRIVATYKELKEIIESWSAS